MPIVAGPFRHLRYATPHDTLEKQISDAWRACIGSYDPWNLQWGLVDFINPIPKAIRLCIPGTSKEFRTFGIIALVLFPITLAVIAVTAVLALVNYLLAGIATLLIAAPIICLKNLIQSITHPEIAAKRKIPTLQKKFNKYFRKIGKEQLPKIDEKKVVKKDNIGAGGFSQVYKSTLNNQTIAVKFPDKPWENSKPEFTREAAMMHLTNHDNIANFIGVIDLKETHTIAIAMEFAPQGDLYTRLHINPAPLAPAFQYNVALDVANALAYLAKNNIIHRDIKSLNVLLFEDGAKISDFGLAIFDSEIEKKQKFHGTPNYMAPEAKKHGEVVIKSDMYSYSVMLQELMIRKEPTNAFPQTNEFIPRPNISALSLQTVNDETVKLLIIQTRKSNPSARMSAQRVVEVLEESEGFTP